MAGCWGCGQQAGLRSADMLTVSRKRAAASSCALGSAVHAGAAGGTAGAAGSAALLVLVVLIQSNWCINWNAINICFMPH